MTPSSSSSQGDFKVKCDGFEVRQFAYISERHLSGGERPMDAAAKQRRMDQVCQKGWK